MNQKEQKQSALDDKLVGVLRFAGETEREVSYDHVKNLLDAGASPNARYYGRKNESMPVLVLAIDCMRKDIVELLLDRGADIEGRDHFSQTALMWAAILHADDEIVELLLDRGADMEARDAKGATALMYAAERKNESCVNMLLERGADMNVRDNENNNIFMYAAGVGSSLYGSSGDISNLFWDRLVQQTKEAVAIEFVAMRLESISQETGRINDSLKEYEQMLKKHEADFKAIGEEIRKDATKFKSKDDSSAQTKTNAERPAIDFHR